MQNRHALITGAGAGIGAAIAMALARAGCRLTLCGRSQDKLQSQAEVLRAQVPELAVLIAPMDVTDEMSVQAAVLQAQAQFGPVNVLVNNAGQVMPNGGDEYNPDVFEETLQINISAAFRLTQLLKALLSQSVLPGGASVINLASLASFFAVEFVPGYGAAKAAVVQMTKTLAVHYAPNNIRVNAVAPGLVASNMTAPMLGFDAMTKPHLDRTPLQRVGQPDEIAPAVLFLASDASRFITGHTLVVDGGFSAKG